MKLEGLDGIAVVGGDKYDGGTGGKLGGGFNAVHFGHFDIEEDEVGFELKDGMMVLSAVPRRLPCGEIA
jgi:hypothetical protein